MAKDINTVALSGRVTRDCSMKYTNSGFQICSFTIAVKKSRKDTNGTWSDTAHFFDCTYFGKAAEAISPYLIKGQQIMIQGNLEQQTWEKNGQKNSKVTVIIDSVVLVGGSPRESQPQQTYNNQPQQSFAPAPASKVAARQESFEDDIPF